MATKNVHQLETRTYIAGILVPTIQVAITGAFNAAPAASITMPPYPELYGMGRRDKIPVQIFTRDTMLPNAEFQLMFEGEIDSFSYESSSSSRNVSFNAHNVMGGLRDVKLSFLTNLNNFMQKVLPAQAMSQMYAVVPEFCFPQSLFMTGLGPTGPSNLIKYPYQFLENMVRFVTRACGPKSEETLPDGSLVINDKCHGVQNESILGEFYGKHWRLLRADDRYVRVPYFDYDHTVWSTPEQVAANKTTCFPVLAGLQTAAGLGQLTGVVGSGLNTQNIYDLVDGVASKMEYELFVPAAPTFHGAIPDAKKTDEATQAAVIAKEEAQKKAAQESLAQGGSATPAPEYSPDVYDGSTLGREFLESLTGLVPSVPTGVPGITSVLPSKFRSGEVIPFAYKDVAPLWAPFVFANKDIPAVATLDAVTSATALAPSPVAGSLQKISSAKLDARYTNAVGQPDSGKAEIAARAAESRSIVPATEAVETPADSKAAEDAEGIKLVALGLKPILYEAVPPTCNIIFRSSVIAINTHESVNGVPTRVRSNDVVGPISQLIGGSDSTLGMFGMLDYYPTSRKGEDKRAVDKTAKKTNIFNEELLETEKFTGPILWDTHAPHWMSYMKLRDPLNKKSASYESDLEDAKHLKEVILKHMYYLKMYQDRRMSVSCTLNPFITPGFPAVVFDNQDSGFIFLGFVTAVSHSYSKGNVGTQVELGFVRLLQDSIDPETRLHNSFELISRNVTHNAEKMTDVYQKLLGADAIDFADIASLEYAAEQEDPQAAYIFNQRKLCSFDQYKYFMGLEVVDTRPDHYGGTAPSVLTGDYVTNRFTDADVSRRAKEPQTGDVVKAVINHGEYLEVTFATDPTIYVFQGPIKGTDTPGSKARTLGVQEGNIYLDIQNGAYKEVIAEKTRVLNLMKMGYEVAYLEEAEDAIEVGKRMPEISKMDSAAATDSVITTKEQAKQPPSVGRVTSVVNYGQFMEVVGSEGTTYLFAKGSKEAAVSAKSSELDALIAAKSVPPTTAEISRINHMALDHQYMSGGVEVKDLSSSLAAIELNSPIPNLDTVAAEKVTVISAPKTGSQTPKYTLEGTRKILKTIADREFSEPVYASSVQAPVVTVAAADVKVLPADTIKATKTIYGTTVNSVLKDTVTDGCFNGISTVATPQVGDGIDRTGWSAGKLADERSLLIQKNTGSPIIVQEAQERLSTLYSA